MLRIDVIKNKRPLRNITELKNNDATYRITYIKCIN